MLTVVAIPLRMVAITRYVAERARQQDEALPLDLDNRELRNQNPHERYRRAVFIGS